MWLNGPASPTRCLPNSSGRVSSREKTASPLTSTDSVRPEDFFSGALPKACVEEFNVTHSLVGDVECWQNEPVKRDRGH